MQEKNWVLLGPAGSTTPLCDTGQPAIASFSSSAWGEGASLQHSIKLSRVEIPGLDDAPGNSRCGKNHITMGSNHGSSKSNVSLGNFAHFREPR